MVIPVVIGTLGMLPKSTGKNTKGIGDKRKNQDHPDHSTVKIS